MTRFLTRLGLFLFGLFLLTPPEAEAQLGRLRDRASRAVERATEPSRDRASEAADRPTSVEKDNAAALAQRAALRPLDLSSSAMPPAVMFESVLRHLHLVPSTGDLRLDYVSVAFPPSRDVDGQPVDYTEQMRFHVQLTDTGDDLLMDRYYSPQWEGNRVFTKFEIAEHNPINRRDLARLDFTQPLALPTPGAYTLHFLLDDREFWRLPFEIIEVRDDDPYNPTPPRYFLRGPWQTYGFLSFAENNNGASPNLYWNQHLQLESVRETRAEIGSQVTLYRDGRIIGRSPTDAAMVNNERAIQTWTFQPPGGGYIRQSDLVDGSYEVRSVLDGQTPAVYVFEVQDGAIVPQGRQVREGTDPLHFIEGINESWWIQPR
ncbi:MAG: hypothetical protein AAF791_13185 [Bacteroidota bacterium]